MNTRAYLLPGFQDLSVGEPNSSYVLHVYRTGGTRPITSISGGSISELRAVVQGMVGDGGIWIGPVFYPIHILESLEIEVAPEEGILDEW